MSINIWTDSMQHAALLGKPVLFTNWLIQRDIIPDGWYCYDLRGTHKSPSTRTTLVDHAADYHAGTVLSPIPLKHEGTASRRVNGTFYLLGEEMTLEQFCEEHDLAYPQDNREFVLRPASLDEVGLFYSEEKLDEALGTVGHLRMDFGHGEKEFWHTWWPHNEDIGTKYVSGLLSGLWRRKRTFLQNAGGYLNRMNTRLRTVCLCTLSSVG